MPGGVQPHARELAGTSSVPRAKQRRPAPCEHASACVEPAPTLEILCRWPMRASSRRRRVPEAARRLGAASARRSAGLRRRWERLAALPCESSAPIAERFDELVEALPDQLGVHLVDFVDRRMAFDVVVDDEA